MSHFATLVIHKEGADIDGILAPFCETDEDFFEFYDFTDEIKKEYSAVTVKRVKMPDGKYYNYGDKETYALRNSTFSTYSILTPDGEWLEPGTMGWFGISSATANEEREWYKSYQSIIKKFAEENPDYVVTLVDCHI